MCERVRFCNMCVCVLMGALHRPSSTCEFLRWNSFADETRKGVCWCRDLLADGRTNRKCFAKQLGEIERKILKVKLFGEVAS